MAYSTNNPPRQILAYGFAAGGGMWLYEGTDAHGLVEAAGYITNGARLGLRVGDLFCSVNTANGAVTWHRVITVGAPSFSSSGPATVSAAVFS